MKLVWKILAALGAVLILAALSMDTTVDAGGQRIHNLGLQAQQQMLLTLGCSLILGAIILFAVVKLKQTPDEDLQDRALQDAGRRKVQATIAEAGSTAAELGRRSGGIAAELLSTCVHAWSKVRRKHVLLVSLVLMGLAFLFPPYMSTSWDQGGVKMVETTYRLVGTAKEDLVLSRLVYEVLAIAFGAAFAFGLAKK